MGSNPICNAFEIVFNVDNVIFSGISTTFPPFPTIPKAPDLVLNTDPTENFLVFLDIL